MPANRRVVITGLGVVSSLGIGKSDFWRNIIAGKSGIAEVTRFDVTDFPVHKAGEIKNFNSADFLPKKICERVGLGSQYAIIATMLAIEDALLDVSKISAGDIGIIVGSTMGEIPSLELIDKFWVKGGEGDIFNANIIKFPVNNLANSIASFFSIEGLNYVIPTACAAGNYSIGYGFDLIRKGSKDLIFAGGADPLSRLAFTGFNRLFAMAPEKCQPFDKNRKGMMLGEGGAILVLEELEHAKKRSAHIYAEVLGYGLSCDAFNMTIPGEKGVIKVMEKAIKNSCIEKSDVDYVSAHGTGTGQNDKNETAAIKEVFGASANSIPISSIKSMLGHTMGTASALEAIACCLIIENGIIPPTINYETPDSECDLDYVPNVARKKNVEVALNNSFAFGGNNACVAFGKLKS